MVRMSALSQGDVIGRERQRRHFRGKPCSLGNRCDVGLAPIKGSKQPSEESGAAAENGQVSELCIVRLLQSLLCSFLPCRLTRGTPFLGLSWLPSSGEILIMGSHWLEDAERKEKEPKVTTNRL